MSFALLRPGIARSCALYFTQPSCALRLKSKGVDYYWLDHPYETLHQKFSHFDRTQYRINENSKSICVEGNIAVGKGTFAKNLADTFYLKYVPDTNDDQMFIDKNFEPGLDYREYNRILPKELQFYTTETLFSDSDPIHHGKPLYLQQNYFMYRCYNWWKACAHIFNTGQGFVMKRSPFSTYILAKAMHECGMMSTDATDWFMYYDKHVISALMNPHLVIYLRSPVSLSRENLNKRAVKWEAGVTDKFLEVVKQVYESDFLPRIAKFSEVFTVDAPDYNFSDHNDVTYLAEQIAKIDLDQRHLSTDIDSMLLQWRHFVCNKDTMFAHRELYANAEFIMKRLTGIQAPDDMPEAGLTPQQATKVKHLLRREPSYGEFSLLNPWDAKSTWDVIIGRTRKDPQTYDYRYDEDSLKIMAYYRSFGYYSRSQQANFRTD